MFTSPVYVSMASTCKAQSFDQSRYTLLPGCIVSLAFRTKGIPLTQITLTLAFLIIHNVRNSQFVIFTSAHNMRSTKKTYRLQSMQLLLIKAEN